ncbi:MAG: Coenzyme F420 hydrogenase/dehydrogenase, beta subunit C-terminal domain [Methanomicrobiales archaeon]
MCGIEPWDVSRLAVRGGLQVTTLSGGTLRIPLTELEASVRPGCRICTDFSARNADISACSAGSPDGWTTIVLRTPGGEGIWGRACAGGTLEVSDAVDLPAVERLARRKMEQSQSRGG